MSPYGPPRSDEELLDRYRANYGLAEGLVTVAQVQSHLALERRLTERLRASTVADRRDTFEAVYDELYGALPWLADTGGRLDPERWIAVIGAPPKRVYEIGSGAGRLASALAEAGLDVTATDVSRERGDGRRDGERLRWASTDGIHLTRFADAAAFDVVLSDQVVEHLHPDDHAEHFSGCLALLRPGGVCVVRTPHAYTGPHDVSLVFGLDRPEGMHLHEFTNGELVRILKDAGFARVSAVLHYPRGFRPPGPAAVASRAYLGCQLLVERALERLPPGRRRRVASALPDPLRPRVFLAARAPA
jgi:2-polyprenyl-3-methyl-5-hydroxy-6-metoxy-1,4-benzoquinol methylase